MDKHGGRVLVGVTIIAVVAGGAWVVMSPTIRDELDGMETITTTDYRAPVPPADEVLEDDRIDDKAPKFDPEAVDRRPIGDWQVNASGSVLRLDTPMLRPDQDEALLKLRPSYKAAVEAAPKYETVLPSVNMIDGKAKQFDDGLVAAIDLATLRGIDKALAGRADFVRRLLDKVGKASPASAYLAAGLALVGDDRPVDDLALKAAWLSAFEADTARSKPIAFYTWNKPLSDCFRFYRYFQAPIPGSSRAVVSALADAIKSEPGLLADYEKALAFAAKLSNPTTDLTVADVARGRAKADNMGSISLYPESTSREVELFATLFPNGLPADVDLMRELIRKVRSGSVSLAPRPDSGWYDYQVHALETMLLPDRGEGADHLLLTREYKKRMLEAFKALMTKRKETHIRDAKTAESAALMPTQVVPRLRLEPCPSYYVRTARAYAFLADVLESSLGPEALKRLHGLKEGGERGPDLHAELRSIRDLFYGFYLLSAEDIGMTPRLPTASRSTARPPRRRRRNGWRRRPTTPTSPSTRGSRCRSTWTPSTGNRGSGRRSASGSPGSA